MKSALLPLAILVPFTIFSVEVILQHGYFGFVELARSNAWGMQLLLDLSISLFFIGSWIRRDAKSRGIVALPYLIALPLLGSIAALAYFVHRALKGAATGPGESAVANR
jgi:hypothetical protein